MTRRACLLFDSDSQYFACLNLFPHLVSGGWSVKFVIIGKFQPPAGCALPTADIIRIADMDELWDLPAVVGSDAIGAYLPGSKLRRVWLGANEQFKNSGVRPLLFTGYNGVVLLKFEEGISWRDGYDLIALNSPEDRGKAEAFFGHSVSRNAVIMPITGINRKHQVCQWVPDANSSIWEKTKRIIFAEQVLFPEEEHEKFYLYSHLLRIALENPEWDIVVKPRTLPDATTFHRQKEHVSQFIKRKFALPSNMRISYDPLDEIARTSTALFSISSTAFFDAISLGVPGFTLSDFGISNNYGTHYFHGSGCTICLADLKTLDHGLFRARPTAEWLEFKGFSARFSPANIVAGLGDLLEAGARQTPTLQIESEQRLLAQPANLPAAYRRHACASLPQVGRKVAKFVSRRLGGAFGRKEGARPARGNIAKHAD